MIVSAAIVSPTLCDGAYMNGCLRLNSKQSFALLDNSRDFMSRQSRLIGSDAMLAEVENLRCESEKTALI